MIRAPFAAALAAAWLPSGAWAGEAAPPKPAAPAKPAVAASTSTAAWDTIESMYPIGKLRDPFKAVAGGGGESAGMQMVELPPEEFTIHGLELKGVMEDRTGGFALLRDTKYGVRFTIRKGRLFDAKNKAVKDVSAVVKVKQKTVVLKTAEDEKILTMGEQEEQSGQKKE